jgi:hypothetical protein
MNKKQKLYPHLDKRSSLGDLNRTAAFILAELQMQNEQMYSASLKNPPFDPVPDKEHLAMLVNFFRRVLDDPATRGKDFSFPLRSYIREDGTHACTLLEDLREAYRNQKAT